MSLLSSLNPVSMGLHVAEGLVSHMLSKPGDSQGQDQGGGMEQALQKAMQHVLSTAAQPG